MNEDMNCHSEPEVKDHTYACLQNVKKCVTCVTFTNLTVTEQKETPLFSLGLCASVGE